MATEKTNIPVPEEHVGEAEDVKNVTESGGRTAVAEAPAVPATAEEESASVKHEGNGKGAMHVDGAYTNFVY